VLIFVGGQTAAFKNDLRLIVNFNLTFENVMAGLEAKKFTENDRKR